MIPYSGPTLFDFYTLSHTKLVESLSLHSRTYPCSLYTEFSSCLMFEVRSHQKCSTESNVVFLVFQVNW